MKNNLYLFLLFISSSVFSMNDEQKAEMIANETIEFNALLGSAHSQINNNDLKEVLEELVFCYIDLITNPENK